LLENKCHLPAYGSLIPGDPYAGRVGALAIDKDTPRTGLAEIQEIIRRHCEEGAGIIIYLHNIHLACWEGNLVIS
jgi:hypothetical protein